MAATSISIGTFGWDDATARSVGTFGWEATPVSVAVLTPPKILRKLTLKNILAFSQSLMSTIQVACTISDKQTLTATAATKQLLQTACATKQTIVAPLQTISNIKVQV